MQVHKFKLIHYLNFVKTHVQRKTERVPNGHITNWLKQDNMFLLVIHWEIIGTDQCT